MSALPVMAEGAAAESVAQEEQTPFPVEPAVVENAGDATPAEQPVDAPAPQEEVAPPAAAETPAAQPAEEVPLPVEPQPEAEPAPGSRTCEAGAPGKACGEPGRCLPWHCEGGGSEPHSGL